MKKIIMVKGWQEMEFRCRLIAILVLIIGSLALSFVPSPVSAHTGSGTAGDPYMIYNVTDLQDMQNHLASYWELANDIDASATATWNWNAGRGVYEGFDSIVGFAGHLDGNYYTISGLYIDRVQVYVGLFEDFSYNVTVQNLLILGANITGTYNCGSGSMSGCAAILVGAILETTGKSCLVQQVIVSGQVLEDFTDPVGPAQTHGYAGGLVGFIYGGANGALIERCAAYVDVACLAHTQAIGVAGGFVGRQGSIPGYSLINDCYVMGAVSATTHVGGFIGWHYSSGSAIYMIDNCYSTATVSAGGGFAKYSTKCTHITDCFWDLDVSGCPTSACGIGKSTTEMKTKATFTSAGWDFDTVWDIGGAVNGGYPYFLWWYNPPVIIQDINQVVWFQPNTIIAGAILPNRAQNGTLIDGDIHWGTNPAGIDISHGELVPEEEYEFEPIIPDSRDIIKPEPTSPVSDVDLERLHDNPLYPLVAILVAPGILTERLVWLGLAWFIVIAAMLAVHLGPDTHKDSEKPQHFILTTIAGLGLSILFYTMGIFPLWVVILMAFGLIGAIIWERQPVL